jgi:hypothetical protein
VKARWPRSRLKARVAELEAWRGGQEAAWAAFARAKGLIAEPAPQPHDRHGMHLVREDAAS